MMSINLIKKILTLMNRLILKIESNFPTLFYWLKKKVIKFLIGNS